MASRWIETFSNYYLFYNTETSFVYDTWIAQNNYDYEDEHWEVRNVGWIPITVLAPCDVTRIRTHIESIQPEESSPGVPSFVNVKLGLYKGSADAPSTGASDVLVKPGGQNYWLYADDLPSLALSATFSPITLQPGTYWICLMYAPGQDNLSIYQESYAASDGGVSRYTDDEPQLYNISTGGFTTASTYNHTLKLYGALYAHFNGVVAESIIKITTAGSLTANAITKRIRTDSGTADAIIKHTATDSKTADAVISLAATDTITADAIIKRALTAFLRARSVIQQTAADSLTAEARIHAWRTFLTDAILQRPRTQRLSAYAWLGGGGLITLNAVIDGRPMKQEDFGIVLKLLYGDDKRHPLRRLNLAEDDANGSIFLREGGFSPAAGQQTVLYDSPNIHRDGERRLAASRRNAQFSITYDLQGGSVAELGELQRRINRFKLEVMSRHEAGEGQKVWLEYRWPDNLASVPAPVWGQLSHYLEVLDLEARWPGDLHSGSLLTGNIEGIAADLVCRPYAEGLAQKAFFTNAAVVRDAYGLQIQRNYYGDNHCPNPSFGHSTWNTGWSASNSLLLATRSTKDGCYRSLGSAARLANRDSSTAHTYTTPCTGLNPTSAYYLSVFVRRPDGAAVTAGDLTLTGSATMTEIGYQAVDDGPWYLLYGQFTAATAADTVGVSVEAGGTVYIDDVQVAIVTDYAEGTIPPPFGAGWMHGLEWDGTAHNSASSRPGSLNRLYPDDPLGPFTVSFWATFPYDGLHQAGSAGVTLFEIYEDASNKVSVNRHLTNGNFYLFSKANGTELTASGSVIPIAYGTPLHFCLVSDTTTRLYLNGTLYATVSQGMKFNAGAYYVTLGDSSSADLSIDGLRIWDVALADTQIQTFYANELPVKQNYGILGLPPMVYNTHSGSLSSFAATEFDNLNGALSGSDKTNWVVLTGVPGDAAARVRWEFDPDPAAAPTGYFLARKAVDPELVSEPQGTFWLDFDGTADSGNSSNDAYQSVTLGAGGSDTFSQTVAQPDFLRGRVQVIARLKTTAAVTVAPFYRLGSANPVIGESVAVAADADFLLRAYQNWDLWIDWPEDDPPPVMTAGLTVTDGGSGATVSLDFVLLLPFPNCRVDCEDETLSLSAGDTLTIEARESYVQDSNGSRTYRFLHRGDAVTVLPDRNNYLWLVQGTDGETMPFSQSATMQLYLTPRWLLAGPPVG